MREPTNDQPERLRLIIEPADLVTAAMIARELETGATTVAMWAARRETNGFPEPVLSVGPRTKLYSRREVWQWLAGQD